MKMIIASPPPQLQSDVIATWALRGELEGRYSGLPKPYVELIVSLSGVHAWQSHETAPVHMYRDGWLTPVQFGPRLAQTVGALHLIGARLSLGAARNLFGATPVNEFDAPIPLNDLLGSEANLLREKLMELPSDVCRMKALASWVERRLMQRSSMSMPPPKVLTQLGWRTDALADYLDISARGLRKRFNAHFGMSPKVWLQLNRFNSVLSAGMSPAGLAQTAADFGYSDQSHMTNEFKRFSGLAPGHYLRSRIQTKAPDDAPHFLPGG